LGGGEAGLTDAAIIRDARSGRPLLPGPTLAGALRASLERRRPEGSRRLFGGAEDSDAPSGLLTFDAIATGESLEVRDGVAISPSTGTAAEHAKYDFEVLAPGTVFPLRVELEITERDDETQLLGLLLASVADLESGDLRLGVRRSRGLGAFRAKNWRARRWDLTGSAGWLDYLGADAEAPVPSALSSFPTLALALGFSQPSNPGEGEAAGPRCHLTLTLRSTGGVLVRQASLGEADYIQFQSGQGPVVPGTSLAGVLRNRSGMIARLVRHGQQDAEAWVSYLFGSPRASRAPTASRVRCSDGRLENGKPEVTHRIRIDRFTGGAADTALFAEEPLFGAQLRVDLTLDARPDKEAGQRFWEPALGLLLLAVRDLLDGDLPVGGTSSVGRGFFHGTANLALGTAKHVLQPGVRPPEEVIKLIRKFHEAPEMGEADANA